MNLTIYIITAALIGFVLGVAVTANMLRAPTRLEEPCKLGKYYIDPKGELYFCAEADYWKEIKP